MRLCSTDLRLINLCRDPSFWRTMFTYRYPGRIIPEDVDPREFYKNFGPLDPSVTYSWPSITLLDTDIDNKVVNYDQNNNPVKLSQILQWSQILPIYDLKIYYPIDGYEKNFIPILYQGNLSVRDILKYITKYYHEPITNEYLQQAVNVVMYEPNPLSYIGMPRYKLMDDHVYFEGLKRYKDGYRLVLGS